jgi:hypothetical protein
MSLQLFFNEGAEDLSKALSASQTDNRTRTLRQQVTNDKIPIEIFASDGKGNIVDLSGGSVKLGIGDKNARASSGDWSLNDGSNIVTVSHNVSTANLQTALRTVTFNGDALVSVDGCALSPYILTYSAVGTRAVPTINLSSLNPVCNGSAQNIVTGDVSTIGKQLINIGAQPIVLVTSFTATTNGGVSGQMALATEGVIQALCGAGGSIQKTLEVEFTDSNGNVRTLGQIPITIAGEVIPDGATGTVQLSSYATEAFVNSKFSSTATFSRSINVNGFINANGGLTLKKTAVATSATISSGGIIEYTSTATTGNISLTVPSVAGAINELFIVADKGGVAETSNITVTFQGATIDGQNSIVINANRGSVQFYKSSANEFKTIGGNHNSNSFDNIPVTKDENNYISNGINQLPLRRVGIVVTSTLSTKNALYGVSGAGRTHTINATQWTAGEWLTVKDEGGNAGASNIIVTVSNGTIDGTNSTTISSNYGKVQIYSNGTNFFTR